MSVVVRVGRYDDIFVSPYRLHNSVNVRACRLLHEIALYEAIPKTISIFLGRSPNLENLLRDYFNDRRLRILIVCQSHNIFVVVISFDALARLSTTGLFLLAPVELCSRLGLSQPLRFAVFIDIRIT